MTKNITDSQYSEKRVKEMLEKLKGLHFRITPQRYAVLRILAASQDHPSVEQIYKKVKAQFPTTSIATVYKTVALLKDLGEILELSFHGGNSRYDGNKPYSHPHAICTKCHKIMDPELTTLDGLRWEMERKTGYKIDSHRLDFLGLCPDCQKEG